MALEGVTVCHGLLAARFDSQWLPNDYWGTRCRPVEFHRVSVGRFQSVTICNGLREERWEILVDHGLV